MAFFDRLKGKKKDKDSQTSEELLGEEIVEEKTESPAVQDEDLSVKDEEITSEETTDEGLETTQGNEEKKVGILARFKKGLTKTRDNISGKITDLVKSSKKLDDDFYEELEDILIQADVGMTTSMELVDNIRQTVRKAKITEPEGVIELIREEISSIMGREDVPINLQQDGMTVIMVVGVNGAGKTTTIAKLAYRYRNEGKKVILAAGDTFRAAAIDQLEIWANRVGVELIKHQEGSDPGAVVFDAINAGRARKADILIIDTAGRLQNKANLMKEIGKVSKVIDREMPGAPHEVLLVLDATTGQNAISQARIFGEATGVSGIVLTKLDGTAKGGIVLAVNKELDIPVKLVGIGEGIEDLRDFSAEIFAQALFED